MSNSLFQYEYFSSVTQHKVEWLTSLDKGTQPFVVCDG